jgi:transglutaminase-like putative cysteine protease
MTVIVDWDHPARVVLLHHLHWTTSSDVAMAVHRWAEVHAPRLPSGRYAIRAAGYEAMVRLDREAGSVLVLYLYRQRH